MMEIFQKDTEPGEGAPLARSRTIWDSKSMLVMDFNLLKKIRIHKFIPIEMNKWMGEWKNISYNRIPINKGRRNNSIPKE